MENLTVTIRDMDYDSLDRSIKSEMRMSARSAVRLGYMLRVMMEKSLWEKEYSALKSARYHLVLKGAPFRDYSNSETELVEFLKNLPRKIEYQKKGKVN